MIIMEQKPREWLKRVREERGLSQRGLAEKIGIHQSNIARFETGEISPKPQVAKKIGQILGIDWTRFYDE